MAFSFSRSVAYKRETWNAFLHPLHMMATLYVPRGKFHPLTTLEPHWFSSSVKISRHWTKFFWKWKQNSVSYFATKKFTLEFTFPGVADFSVFMLRTRIIKVTFFSGNMEPLHMALFFSLNTASFCFCFVFQLKLSLHCDRRETTVFQEIVTGVALPLSVGVLALSIFCFPL